MPLTTAGKNNLINVTSFSYAGALTDIAATPTEVSGGSYSRQRIHWNAASGGGLVTVTNSIDLLIPGSTTVVAVGVWDALTGGTLQMFNQIVSNKRGVATVAATGDLFTKIGHGLVTDDRVFFTAPAGQGTLPAGLSATTIYFVRSGGTSNTFTVATTSGGAAVNITANGEVAWFKTVPEVFVNAGNLQFSSGFNSALQADSFG